jgi:glycosyltransferase involved in cell wall biosynthesis
MNDKQIPESFSETMGTGEKKLLNAGQPTQKRQYPDVDRPRLSICIPTFNRADILRETLEHLYWVCDADVEIVVADNASSDHSQQVIEEFRPKFRFYRTLRHSKNLGALKNVSSAMSLATGKYVYTLSDDDAIYYDGLQTAIRLMEENPAIAGVYGSYQEWDRNTDKILGTMKFVETRADFVRGDKVSIFNRFALLWFPVCRTDIYRRYFSYDDFSFGMWPLVGTLIEHGNVAVIPEIFYKHAHTEPRMEFELTEGWYHDCHRAQYEVYVGRGGQANPQELANFVNSRVGPAYMQGARFALMKNQILKARHFILRARAYGFVDEASVMQWEQQFMVPMIAERLLGQIELLPHVREVLFESDPKLDSVKARFASITESYPVGSVAVDGWQTSPMKPDQFLVTYMYKGELRGMNDITLLSLDPARYRSVQDLIESCRLTNQALQS